MMLSWLLETLLGLSLAGLTVAGLYEAWQNRRSLAALWQSGVAVAAALVGIFVIRTWPWQWLISIAEWLFNWLAPHLFKWVVEILEFLILTVLVEVVTLAWEFLTNLSGNFYTLPLLAVLGVWLVYLKFSHKRDQKRFRKMEAEGSSGKPKRSKAVMQIFRSVFKRGLILGRRLKNGL